MEKLGDIIKVGEYKKVKPVQKFNLKSPLTASQFADLFLTETNNRMVFTDDPYIVDDDNKILINQLYYYITCNVKFDGNLSKGILLIGRIGNGKTLIMEAFASMFAKITDKVITQVSAKDIVNISNKYGFDYLYKRPAYIDDIGKEQVKVNTFGTVSKPMEDLINERYKNEALTFATSNLKLIDMPYSQHTKDRINQMFNIIELPGKSRRK